MPPKDAVPSAPLDATPVVPPSVVATAATSVCTLWDTISGPSTLPKLCKEKSSEEDLEKGFEEDLEEDPEEGQDVIAIQKNCTPDDGCELPGCIIRLRKLGKSPLEDALFQANNLLLRECCATEPTDDQIRLMTRFVFRRTGLSVFTARTPFTPGVALLADAHTPEGKMHITTKALEALASLTVSNSLGEMTVDPAELASLSHPSDRFEEEPESSDEDDNEDPALTIDATPGDLDRDTLAIKNI